MVSESQLQTLKERALANRAKAYCPYSNFHVGCCLLANGEFFDGANVENASRRDTGPDPVRGRGDLGRPRRLHLAVRDLSPVPPRVLGAGRADLHVQQGRVEGGKAHHERDPAAEFWPR